MFHLLQTYVAANDFMLQVLHDQAREVSADGGGPLVRAESEAGATAPTCMCRCMHNRSNRRGRADKRGSSSVRLTTAAATHGQVRQ